MVLIKMDDAYKRRKTVEKTPRTHRHKHKSKSKPIEKEKKRKTKHKHKSSKKKRLSKCTHSSSSSSSSPSPKHKKKKKDGTVDDIGTKSDEEIGPQFSGNPQANRCNIKTAMTKEEWDKQQSIIRRVYDPDTGRNRLVRGAGEIIEEIVSKDRQRQINKLATAGDGVSFQMQAGLMKRS